MSLLYRLVTQAPALGQCTLREQMDVDVRLFLRGHVENHDERARQCARRAAGRLLAGGMVGWKRQGGQVHL